MSFTALCAEALTCTTLPERHVATGARGATDTLGRLYVGTVTGRQLIAFDTRTLAALASRDVPLPVTALAVTGLGLAVVSDREAAVSFYPLSVTLLG